MNDDELLAAAHQAVKEKDPLANAQLDAFARGELSTEQSDALMADPRAHAAFAPLDTSALEQLVVEKMQPKAKVLPFRRFRAWAATAVALAAAAMFLLVLKPQASADFPAYEMTVLGEKLERSGKPAAGTPVLLGPGSRIEIVLRPAVPFHSSVSVRVFLVRNGSTQFLNVPVQTSQEGAVRIVGSFDEVFQGIAAGPAELVAAIGFSGRVPEEHDLFDMASEAKDLQIIRTQIRIVAR